MPESSLGRKPSGPAAKMQPQHNVKRRVPPARQHLAKLLQNTRRSRLEQPRREPQPAADVLRPELARLTPTALRAALADRTPATPRRQGQHTHPAIAAQDAASAAEPLADWDRRDWAAAYVDCEDEGEGYWMEVEGVLPPDICGTYMRNGPGTFTLGGQHEVAHPFDGDGMVASVSIRDGRAFFRARHVATLDRATEKQAGRRVFRGTFGTAPSGPWPRRLLNPVPKNVANTNVIEWGPRCWALFESGQPYRLEPDTLATEGLDSAGGLFRPNLPFTTGAPWLDALAGFALRTLHPAATALQPGPLLGGDAVISHPKIDPARRRLVTLQYRLRLSAPSGVTTEVTFTEIDPDWEQPLATRHELPGYCFLHDFVITPNYYCVFLNPLHLDLPPLILGQASPIHAVDFRPATPTTVRLLPRPHRPDLAPLSFTLPHPAFVFHANAFERPVPPTPSTPTTGPVGSLTTSATNLQPLAAMEVVVDSVQYPELPDFHGFSGPGHHWRDVDADAQPPSRLVRLRLNLATSEVSEEAVSPRVMEFPSVSPNRVGLPTRYVYSAAALHPTLNRPQQSVAKTDMETGTTQLWTRGHRYYVSEPAFIPRPRRTPPTHPPSSSNPSPGPSQAASQLQACQAPANLGPTDACDAAEDEGWVVALCYDAAAARSEVVVLDAQDVQAGPVAVLKLRRPVPHGLHGSWVPTYHGPRDSAMAALA